MLDVTDAVQAAVNRPRPSVTVTVPKLAESVLLPTAAFPKLVDAGWLIVREPLVSRNEAAVPAAALRAVAVMPPDARPNTQTNRTDRPSSRPCTLKPLLEPRLPDN